jgi:hypothetical protein
MELILKTPDQHGSLSRLSAIFGSRCGFACICKKIFAERGPPWTEEISLGQPLLLPLDQLRPRAHKTLSPPPPPCGLSPRT